MTDTIAARYRLFGAQEARGRSGLYEALATGVAADAAVLAFLAELPLDKQQPNLLFAAVRAVCGTAASFSEFRHHLLADPYAVRGLMLRRRTQTNEPGRCAVLVPVLATIPGPLALIEVGVSAGLCLLPDRYGYDYGGAVLPGEPMLRRRLGVGIAVPQQVPVVAWRAGLDLDPIDLTDADAVAWLEALVWPDQPERLARLMRSIAVARVDPVRVIRGDLRTDTVTLVRQAAAFGTVVVFHTAVLAYLPAAAERQAFGASMMQAGAIWISNEAAGVMPTIAATLDRRGPDGAFLLSVDGRRRAWTDPMAGG